MVALSGTYILRMLVVINVIGAILFFIKDVVYTGNSIYAPAPYLHNKQNVSKVLPQQQQQQQKPSSTDVLTDWVCSNTRRIEYLKNMCRLRNGTIPYSHARLLEDKKHNVLYCEVSKAGCTTVKAIWIGMNSVPPGSKVLNTSSLSVHGQEVHDEGPLAKVGIKFYRLNLWTNQFQNNIKFITVRHPYDRLVSGYYNLIYWKPGRGDGQPYIKAHFKKRFQDTIKGNLTKLTFEEFLTVITEKQFRVYQDRHWKPYTESCYVCQVEYDYILKTETLYRDLEDIAWLLGHPNMTLVGMPLNAYKRETHSAKSESAGGVANDSGAGWTKHLPEFGTLSPDMKININKRFKNDMDLFGYHFDEKTNMASCLCSTSGDIEKSGGC